MMFIRFCFSDGARDSKMAASKAKRGSSKKSCCGCFPFFSSRGSSQESYADSAPTSAAGAGDASPVAPVSGSPLRRCEGPLHGTPKLHVEEAQAQKAGALFWRRWR